jgi:type 1 glutamine amidotransferase
MTHRILIALLSLCFLAGGASAQGPVKKKLLLLSQGPDGHPKETHEYELGQKILQKVLSESAKLDVTIAKADEPWREGPELIDKTDGVVMFLSEGANWLSNDPKRLAAFQRLAKRGGGIAAIHWAMGTKDAKNIQAFVDLAGGCHGGPDRKYKVLFTEAFVADPKHPVARAIKDFSVRDEFYYKLKTAPGIKPLIQAEIDGAKETVAWTWQRDDGGRSFGFSGLHFHDNWRLPQYRRLVAQGVLWTIGHDIPPGGIELVPEEKKDEKKDDDSR